ncbi:MAG: type III-A CRISPR-associated RAMP protein Csm3 [candidate division Zixibacteria bacterium]|nr:type III-A CRISPR-associated RAMP protein Csm3 [candidate division Zixibacteria bacterium]
MKLEGFKTINGQIECLTGLKIGGTKESVGMGETDNPIIRHPISRMPYIPGSSIKGKLRSLLELKYSKTSQDFGKPCDCGECFICKLFGCGNQQNPKVEPTRLIFRDAKLRKDSEEQLEEYLPGTLAETKSEIAMDRKSGKVAKSGPRPVERIPEGSFVNFSISIRLFEEDTPAIRKEYTEKLADAFDMLENDYLGGCGTRGYGKVKITAGDGKPMSEYLKSLSW